MTSKQERRGDLAYDLDRGHIAGQGQSALDKMTQDFAAAADIIAQEKGIQPKDVTFKDYQQWLEQHAL